jgi:phage terminase large subunit-like protein
MVDLARWRNDPAGFIEHALHDPQTGEPFVLLPAERQFLAHAFELNDDGRLRYSEWLYSCPKKSGKTTLAAIICLVVILLHGQPYPEATLAADDLEQAQSRVYEMIKRIIEAPPLLKREARILADRIIFPALNATITAISASFAGAAGGNQCLSVFDELWAYSTERSSRLWDELPPPPNRRIAARLVVTYAGFEGESTLLEGMYRRGLAQPCIGEDLYAGDGLLMFWSHKPVATWQTPQWIEEQRRTQRASAFQRQILNEFAPPQSRFVDLGEWDGCVQPITPVHEDRMLHVWAGVDASTKRDSTALVAVTFDQTAQCARLVQHCIFTPSPGDPIQFDAVEALLLDWHKRYRLRKALFDPLQMEAIAQRLTKAGVPIESFPQTVPNLTAATSNLFDLIQSRQIALYPNEAMRLAASRAILHESARGWRIDKLKQSHKIDVIVALSMACHAAVQAQGESYYDENLTAFADDYVDPDSAAATKQQQQPQQQPQLSAQQFYGGDWWRSGMAGKTPAYGCGGNADENLKHLYAAIDGQLRFGPPGGGR